MSYLVYKILQELGVSHDSGKTPFHPLLDHWFPIKILIPRVSPFGAPHPPDVGGGGAGVFSNGVGLKEQRGSRLVVKRWKNCLILTLLKS